MIAREDVTGVPQAQPVSSWDWAWVVLPAVIWFLDLQVSYSLVYWACAQHVAFALPVISLIAVCLVAVIGIRARRRYVARGTTSESATDRDWRGFLLLLTFGGSLTFVFVIIANGLPRFFIDPCIR